MKKIEAKLRGLEGVRPDRDFVVNAKARIMGREKPFSFGFSFVPRGAFLIVPVLLAGVIMGWHFYTYNVKYPRISSADLADLETASRDLEEVEKKLVWVREGLERIDEPEEVLKISRQVASTVQDAEKVVRVSKEIAEAPQSSRSDSEVFSVMSGVEYAADSIEKATRELEETYITRQKEIALQQIEEMEEMSLNEEQAGVLEEAKDLYNKGEFEQALQKVLEAQSY